MTGGTINSSRKSIWRDGNEGKGTISGGTIIGGFRGSNGEKEITGGKFSFDPSSLLSSAYKATKSGQYWVVSSAHTHSFTYSASGATITATCSNTGCTLTENPTLTIVKPTLETYGQTGKSAAATLTGLEAFNTVTGKSIAATDIKYVGRAGTTYAESATAPTNAGKYTAKITLRCEDQRGRQQERDRFC